jgi:hypothetical protein
VEYVGNGHGKKRVCYIDELPYQPLEIRGAWGKENLLVEKVMQPVLRIARYLLSSEQAMPWVSALEEEIDKDDSDV